MSAVLPAVPDTMATIEIRIRSLPQLFDALDATVLACPVLRSIAVIELPRSSAV